MITLYSTLKYHLRLHLLKGKLRKGLTVPLREQFNTSALNQRLCALISHGRNNAYVRKGPLIAYCSSLVSAWYRVFNLSDEKSHLRSLPIQWFNSLFPYWWHYVFYINNNTFTDQLNLNPCINSWILRINFLFFSIKMPTELFVKDT